MGHFSPAPRKCATTTSTKPEKGMLSVTVWPCVMMGSPLRESHRSTSMHRFPIARELMYPVTPADPTSWSARRYVLWLDET